MKESMEKFEYKRAEGLRDVVDEKLIDIAQNLSFSTPKYKLENFVGGAQITPYAKFRQWFMELRTREDACEHLEYLLKKKEIEIQLEQEKMQFLTNDLNKEYSKITIMDMEIDLRKYKRNIKDAYKERQIFIDLIKDFLESEEGKLPTGESFIEVFENPELEDKFEKEHWTVRMAKQSMLDMIAYGRIGTGNLDSILMMEPEQQQEVLALASHYTIAVDKNINQLMGMAATNTTNNLIENNIKEQLKLGSIKNNETEQLL